MKNTTNFHTYSQSETIDFINKLSCQEIPFLFFIDFQAKNSIIIPQDQINEDYCLYKIGKYSNCIETNHSPIEKLTNWEIKAVSQRDYTVKFNKIQREIHRGNSFLINLTQPTQVTTNLSLKDIFLCSHANYKLWLNDWFVVFSPETFIRIVDNKISSYPMKGTIDASIPDAEKKILTDEKEKAEHATIVDLIRNDLSMVAENVEVKKYRYIDMVRTNNTDLLQVSSHIEGTLPDNYLQNLGEIIFKLLPAGSVSGAPKKKTVEIILQTEQYDRGFYTGICGFFDGQNLESAVMIRFIEKIDNQLIYKSGGGITFLSEAEKEYEELIQKVYVPIY